MPKGCLTATKFGRSSKESIELSMIGDDAAGYKLPPLTFMNNGRLLLTTFEN